jgi:hypothetical protein
MKKTTFFWRLFLKTILVRLLQNRQLSHKPPKNPQNLEENAFYPLIPAPFSHFSELILVVT